ncbi:hypothetical protein YC2023_109382 [Brassica napus]
MSLSLNKCSLRALGFVLREERTLCMSTFVLAPPWWSRLETEPFSGADAHPWMGHGQAMVFGLGRQSKSAYKFPGGQCEYHFNFS